MRAGLTAALLLAAGCGGDGLLECTGSGDPEALSGSYCEGSPIRWDTVVLGFLPSPPSIRIRYGIDEGDRVSPRFQIQLVEETVRLEAGVRIPLGQAASVRRWPEDGRDPQELSDRLDPATSRLVFDSLSLEPGGRAAGEFDLLLDTGRTLGGRFEGTLDDLRP